MNQSSIQFIEYQKKLIEILSFFDKFCRDNDIKYTVIDGTLIGAVRHKGLIPWDGDVDVALTPTEFAKLKRAFNNYSGKYYLNYLPNHTFQKRGRKHDFPTLTAKVIDKTCSSSIFGIDVFTIDFLGNDYEYAKKTIKIYKRFNSIIKYIVSIHIPEGNIYKRTIAIILYPFTTILSKLFTPIVEQMYLNFRKRRIDNNKEDCKYFTIEPYLNRFGIEPNTILKDGYINMDFEDFQVMAVSNFDAYLIPTYGDYMMLPPENKRIPYPSEDILTKCKFSETTD